VTDGNAIRDTLANITKKDQELILVISTQPKLPKKSAYYGVNKISTVQVAVNYDYYERAKKHDPNFEFKPKEDGATSEPWYERVGTTCLLKHKSRPDGLYLDCWVVKSLGYDYFNEKGEVVDKYKVNVELPDRGDTLLVRRYKLDSIQTVQLCDVVDKLP
jgi:hypothetical protein